MGNQSSRTLLSSTRYILLATSGRQRGNW